MTLAQAEASLAAWLAADLAVATGQSYTIAGRGLTRADAAEIRTNIQFWNRQVGRLQSGSKGISVRGITPVG